MLGIKGCLGSTVSLILTGPHSPGAAILCFTTHPATVSETRVHFVKLVPNDPDLVVAFARGDGVLYKTLCLPTAVEEYPGAGAGAAHGALVESRGRELPAPHTRAGGRGCRGDGHRDTAGAEGFPWGCQGIRGAFAGTLLAGTGSSCSCVTRGVPLQYLPCPYCCSLGDLVSAPDANRSSFSALNVIVR